MRLKKHSLRKQPSIRLGSTSTRFQKLAIEQVFPRSDRRRTLLLTLIVAGSLLAESIAITGYCLAQASPFEYHLSKLRAESARLEREKGELIRQQQIEGSRVASYNSALLRVLSEFQNHIADQHQQYVSCKKCRQLTKQMSGLSKKIERGVR